MSAEGRHHATLVVHLKGIPLKANAADVVSFFSGLGLEIDDSSVQLKFRERKGAGEAIVTFKTSEDAKKALTKDRELFCESKFGSRFIRVKAVDSEATTTTTTTAEEQTTLSGQRHQLPRHYPAGPSVVSHPPISSSLDNQKTAIKISSLPPNISVDELVQLFWGTPAKSSTTVVHRDPGQPHAHAYMDLGAPEYAAHAVPLMNGTVVTTVSGVFKISVRAASRLEYKTAAATVTDAILSTKEGILPGEDTAVIVKIRGLPIKATLADTLAFFEGYKIKQQQPSNAPAVHIQPIIGGNSHSKVAYVEFETVSEATRALDKNQTTFGKAYVDRYCSVQKISRQEMMAEIARNSLTTAPMYSNNTSFSNGSLEFTTSCASPAAFFPAEAFMMPPLPPAAAAAAHPPLPYPQMPWGALPPGYFHPQMHAQFAANFIMQQQQQLLSSMMMPTPEQMLWQQQQQQQQQQQPSGARYMVHDLSTGQKIYLDPKFNFFGLADGSGAPAPGASPAAPMFSPRPSKDQMVPNVHIAAALQQQAQQQVVAEPSGAVPSSLPVQPGNEGRHHPTTEIQIAGEQGSNEGSEGQEHSPETPPATVAAAAAGPAEVRGDQRNKDRAEEGNKDDVHHKSHHHHHHHHCHHHHVDNNTMDGSGGASAVVAGPLHSDHSIVPPKDGHKRQSMELNLPEDDRPVKHSHPEGHE